MHVIDAEAMKQKGIFLACGPHELMRYTTDGWRLVCIAHETKIEEATREEVVPGFAYGDNSYSVQQPQRHQLSTPVMKNEPVFILMKDPDTVAMELRERLETLQDNYLELEKTKDKYEDELKACTEELKKLSLTFDDVKANREYYKQRLDVVFEVSQKQERTIAAVRSAIGEIRMQEIVAAEEAAYQKRQDMRNLAK